MLEDIFKDTEQKMQVSVTAFKNDLKTIRTGHASPSLIEHLKVDYAGTPMPLNQLAGISAPEARLLVVHPWDKSAIGAIEKAIMKSELGLNPNNDGNVIRIAIPQLSEERRQELIRIVKKRVEERKIMVRNIRHEAVTEVKKLEKDKEISQDDQRRADDHIQKLTDRFAAEVDRIGRDKEAELMEV